MSKFVVCPACAHGMCSACTGPGCYCDCQMPDDSDDLDFMGWEDPDDVTIRESGYC